MAEHETTRRLVAILAADVAGYSRLMGDDEQATVQTLSASREVFHAQIVRTGGRLVDTAGDSVLAEFPSVVEAVQCAVAVQAELHDQNAALPEHRRMLFRIGINLGDVLAKTDGTIYGDGVNIAARLESLADPGGLCVSEAVRSAVGTKLPVAYAFLGERAVKNIAEPVRTYRVVAAEEAGETAATRPPCPYPGMVPFRAEDARFFYGRDDEISQMVQLLRRQRFLMVIGPSGSGKSSLVYAGLLPALGQSRYFAEGYWLMRQMRPGPSPTETLAALVDAPEAEFAYGTVQTLLEAHPPAQRLLLLVDQFEEVFTQADREEGRRFIAALQALRTPENCVLILTLRADFYPDLMTSYLWPVDASQRVEVAPLRGEALRQAIQRPAADVGVRIDETLVSQLLADAADEPGALPLLQETMGLLWDDMEQRTLPYSAYQRLSNGASRGASGRLSGLAVAIAMKADATLSELNQSQQTMARRIFLRLIQFGEGRADTRRQQPVASLHAANDAPGEFERTLEHLTDNRLVTRSGGDEQNPPAVDISHESLIGGWSRLQVWADERREAEQIRRRLEGKAAEWVRLGKGSGGLLGDAELPEAEHWLAGADAADLGFDATLPELVAASQQAIEEAEKSKETIRQRELAQAQALADERGRSAGRMRRAMIGLAAVLLVAIAAGVFAWTQSQKARSLAVQEASAREEAEARRVEAQKAEGEAKRLAQSEALARTESETRRAEAENARVEAENAKIASIAQLLSIQAPQQQAALLDEKGALMARQGYLFSATGSPRLKAQVDGALRTVVGKPHFSSILAQEAEAVALSPDGTKLAAATVLLGQVLVWDLEQRGAQPVVLAGYPGDKFPNSFPVSRVYALAFSPNGKTLLAANADGSIGKWDLDNPQAHFVELPRHKGGVWSAVFSPDGHWLAMGSKLDDTFAVWDVTRADGEPVLVNDPQPEDAGSGPRIERAGGVPVAFSPDSATLVSGSLGGVVRLWRPDDLTTPVASLRGHEGGIHALVFHPDGKYLASSGEDATIRVWALENASAAPVVLASNSGPVTSLDFDFDGQTLASSTYGGGISLRQFDALERAPVVLEVGQVWDLVFGPLGKRLVSSGANASALLRVWDLEPSGRPRVLAGHRGAVQSVAFSADMKLLASGSSGEVQNIRLWRWDDLGAPPVEFRGHEQNVNSLNFSADGTHLLSASVNDNSIRLWEIGQPSPTFTALPVPAGTDPWTAIFGPDEGTVMATSVTGAYAWNLANLTAEPMLVQPSPNWGTELAFSPGGDTLAVAGWFPDIYLKDLTRPDTPASTLRGHDDAGAWSVTFSPDGNRLASSGIDGSVRLWDLSLSDSSSVLLGRHDAAAMRVRFSPDGKQLASVSMDHSVRLWNVENPDALPIVLSEHEGAVLSLAYSPDGKHLVTGSVDKTIRIWDLTHPLNVSTTKDVADRVCQKVWRNLTLDEWHKFVGIEIPYERTCPNLPTHPSLFEAAEKLAKENDMEGAVSLLERAVQLDPELELDPVREAQRLAESDAP